MRRLLGPALVAASVLAWTGSAAAAPADGAVQIRHVDLRGFPNVKLTVSFAGALVSPSDVRVFENGLRVETTSVRALGSSGGSVDVVLAIDTSDSMRGEPVATAFAAARAFLARVPSWVDVGILTFADSPRVLAPVSASRSASAEAVAGVPPTTRGTALYDAVAVASEMFTGSAQRNVVLLTDGHNTVGSSDLDSAVAVAREAGVAVFTVGLRADASDETTLARIAEGTGGEYAGASRRSLEAAFEGLATRLSTQYIVTYRSAAPVGIASKVTVAFGHGRDARSFLAPMPRTNPASGSSALAAFLRGSWGMSTVLALCFVALVLAIDLLLGRRYRDRRKRVLSRRMLALPAQPPAASNLERRGPLAWIPDALALAAEQAAPRTLAGRVARSLERAGWAVRPGEFMTLCAIVGLVGTALGIAVLPLPALGVVLGVVAGSIPPVFLGRSIDRRRRMFQEQLPDLLAVLATSLRAGHSFLQGLDAVTREADEPAASEFIRIVTEIRLGRPGDETLLATADRMGSDDFRWAVMAINIQRQVGGNLAEILDTVAATVRERELVRRQVRVLSAEGRLSVAILVAMPFVIAAYLFAINPGYLSELIHTGIGVVLLGTAGFLMLVGLFWMRKIVRIDV